MKPFNQLIINRFFYIFFVSFIISNNSYADDISATDLLNLLVAEGVISEEKAISLVNAVRKRQQRAETAIAESEADNNSNTIRVPYVPNAVKDEIRNSVAMDLRSKVTEDVVAQAKSERWGVPDALPDWVNRIKVTGDARVRYEKNIMDDNNEYFAGADVNELNNAGGFDTESRKIFKNVRDDRERLRARLRLNFKAKVTEGIEVGARLVTGNSGNPVSANQTLENIEGKWDTSFDLAYIKYESLSKNTILNFGKFKNPFIHSDLVWDSDFNFEGLAGQWYFLRKDNLNDDFRQIDPFIKVGAFPISETHQFVRPIEDINFKNTNDDVWLYAVQLGFDYTWFDQSTLQFGLAYYKYDNIRGQVNPVNSDLYDYTALDFYQSGNSVQNIRVNFDNADTSQYFALASDFNLFNTTLKYDYAGFSPYHVWAELDYVKNIGFKRLDIADRIGRPVSDIPDRDVGYQIALSVGWPNLSQRGNWKVGVKYRHLEGDAVLSSFTDSDFLLGGTGSKGYILSGYYAVKENFLIGARLISADELDAAIERNTAIDTFQLDINTKF